MFELINQPSSLRLLQWIKELPSASASDPLGLSLRVSARLANELLYCITSITPRARYYAFFPWAFQDYNDHEHATPTDRGWAKGVLLRERAMVLGAVLHHGGPCEGGALGGSDKAGDLLKEGKRPSYNLAAWKHLKASEGQFGAAYKGSLINLGLFKTDATDVDDEPEEDTQELSEEARALEVRELSSLGKRLADAYARSISRTRYVRENWTLRDDVDAEVLEELGSVGGLCELSLKEAVDRKALRDVFFSCRDEMTGPAQQRRRMSLLFILRCVEHAHGAGLSLNGNHFGDICYYEALLLQDGSKQRVIPFRGDNHLSDIAQRWRIYQAHSYLGVALQSFLVTCVRVLREHRGGLAEDALPAAVSAQGIRYRFLEVTGIDLVGDFFDLTPREMLVACGIPFPKEASNSLTAPRIDAPLSESALEELLTDGEANENAGVALAALLLYQVLLRCSNLTSEPIQNWYRQQIYDSYADLSLTVVADFLIGEFGNDWIDRPNRDVLRRIIWRFVIRQHQTMSYERGFGGTGPLFQVDGTTVIGTSTDYDDPQLINPRFSTTLQILDDLGLIEDDGEIGYQLTEDGASWLQEQLARGILI